MALEQVHVNVSVLGISSFKPGEYMVSVAHLEVERSNEPSIITRRVSGQTGQS